MPNGWKTELSVTWSFSHSTNMEMLLCAWEQPGTSINEQPDGEVEKHTDNYNRIHNLLRWKEDNVAKEEGLEGLLGRNGKPRSASQVGFSLGNAET